MAALHAECFDSPWSAESMARITALPGVTARIVRTDEGDEPVGFVVWRLAADEAEIITIGVRSRFRRQGIGRSLVEYVERAAAERDARRLVFEVAIDNIAALRLYRRNQYREVGRRQAYYRDAQGRPCDAVIMARNLPIRTAAGDLS